MKLANQWQKQIFAAVLGAAVVGAPLFTAHAADPAFSRDGQQYDVRRGMYADKEHQEARSEERREDLEKRQNKEREDFEKRQEEERKDFEKQQAEERKSREEPSKETRSEAHSEEKRDGEPREYKYDVRRGMYEQEGGSDTQVRRGMYEQPNEDGQRSSLTR